MLNEQPRLPVKINRARTEEIASRFVAARLATDRPLANEELQTLIEQSVILAIKLQIAVIDATGGIANGYV